MNADLQKITSLVTAIKMAEKEFDKQVTKETDIKNKEGALRKERDDLLAKIKEIETDLNAPLEDEELKAMKTEYETLEKTVETKADEKALITEIDEMERKVQDLERLTKSLNDDIAAISSGTYDLSVAGYEMLDNPEENLRKREELAKKVTIKREKNGRLSVKTIQQLIDGCLEYYKPKFIILASRERKERRQYIDDLKKWIDTSLRLFEEIDKTTDESQREFLDILGIDFNDFNNEVENYCKEGNHQILLLMSIIPQKMKAMLKAHKNLNKNQVKDIMKFQISLVIDELPKLIPNLPMPNPMDPNFNPEKIALLVNNRVNDLMWQKFKIEEEDFIEAMKKPTVANDLEINQLAMQMEMMMMQMGVACVEPEVVDSVYGEERRGDMSFLEHNYSKAKFHVRLKRRNGRVKHLYEELCVEGCDVKFISATSVSMEVNQSLLPKVQFNLELSEKERSDRANVVLPFEHQGKGEPIRIYDGRRSLPEARQDPNLTTSALLDETEALKSANAKGEIHYLRDSDDERPDSDEDPDDDLDI